VHKVKLTDSQKRDWFTQRIKDRMQVSVFESEIQLVDFVRTVRRQFKETFERDVPGSFIRQILSDLGVAREHSDGVKKKRDYMFCLMDNNQNFRENKSQLRKMVEAEFGECILAMVFDELWDEYHNQECLPEPKSNIDIYGQSSLF